MTSHRVLMVDDNPGDVELVRIALEGSGLQVVMESVDNGIAAIRWLIHASGAGALPSLVLLDLNMPSANGFEVLDFMSVRHLTDRIPVVVLTSSQRPADRRRCMAYGVRAMHSKGDSFEGISQLVDGFRAYLS